MSTRGLSLPFSSAIDYSGILSASYQSLRNLFSLDMAMDLGTANTLIYIKNQGIVVNEPSVVAVAEDSGEALAVGHMAKEMFGKTSRSIKCVRPMKDGVIADFAMTSLMIKHMLSQAKKGWSARSPRIVIGVPSGITQVEKRAVIDTALSCGIRSVMLAEEPMAAALGCGLPVEKAVGNMIVDIGGGTTEVAILSMNSTLYSHSIRVAGDEMDEAIQRHIKKVFGLQIGIFEAERIKLILGSALPFGKSRHMHTYGRDVASGIPNQVEISDDLVRESLQEPLAVIISSIMAALEQTSPEIAQDIVSRGIYLAGGGSLLKGLAERLHRETGIKFYRANDPLSCVVRGVGMIADNYYEMRELCIS